MTVHSRSKLDRIGRSARREFSRAYMSDTKWRKLFLALFEAVPDLQQIMVKFIDVPEPRVMSFRSIGLHPPRPYVDTLEFGPVELRSIEWLEIPAVARWRRSNNVPSEESPQDLAAVSAVLSSLGQFPIEATSEAIRIVGYRR